MSRYKYSQFNTIIDDGDIVIFNSFVNSLAILERAEFDFLNSLINKDIQEENLSEYQNDLINRSIINNFIVYEDTDELKALENVVVSRKENKNSLTITILPTISCNLNCTYCFEGEKKGGRMNKEVQYQLLQWIGKQINGLKNLNVCWFGGEPTLAPNIIKDLSNRLIKLCKSNNVTYSASIVTNATLMDLNMAKMLDSKQVKTVQITLDGPQRIHDKVRCYKSNNKGTFNEIINNVKQYAKKVKFHTVFRINVDTQNESYCFELIEELARLLHGVPNVSVYFAPIHATTNMCKHIAKFTMESMQYARLETQLIEFSHKMGLMKINLPSRYIGLCAAARKNGIVVSPNGDVHKCWETVTMDKFKIGNIKDPDFDLHKCGETWTSWSPLKEQSCRNCSILPNCMGMCTYRFLFKENLSGETAVTPCPSIKFDFENRIRLYLKKINSNNHKKQ